MDKNLSCQEATIGELEANHLNIEGLRVLVTGGAGFIGSHIVDQLLTLGCEVFVIDNLLTGKRENIKRLAHKKSFHFWEEDIRNKEAVKAAVKDIDAVFHEAALVSVSRSVKNPALTNEINVRGTLNLLLACLNSDVQSFVYASSSSVYGESERLPKQEEQISAPVSPYGVSKMAAENYVKVFHEVYGLKTICLRYFNVYGPRQTPGPYSGVISIFTNRLLKNRPPVIYGDGEQMRDFTYVKDVVRANLLALGKKEAVGEVFNIATGKPTTVNKLAMILIKAANRLGLEPVHASPRPGDIVRSYADISKAGRILGYLPAFSLEKGLAEYVGWCRSKSK